MVGNDQTQDQSPSVATESAVAGSLLAHDLWHRHVEAPGVISARTAIRLARRASPATARLSSHPIRRLQRMVAEDADDPQTSLPTVRAAAVSVESAIQGTGSQSPEAGSSGVETGWASANMANLGTAIMRRHVTESLEGTIQRLVVTQEQPYARAHGVLPHQPGAMLARRPLDTSSGAPVVPARLPEAPGPGTPSASMSSVLPAETTIQRQATTGVASWPMARQPAQDSTPRATVRPDRTDLTSQTTMIVARIAAQATNEPPQPGSPALVKPARLQLSRMAEPGGRERPAMGVLALARPVAAGRADTPLVLSRVSTGEASLIARQETASMPGAAAPTASEPTAANPVLLPPAAASRGAGQPADLNELVEKALRRFMRHLAVEGERRGWTRWP